MPGSEKVLDEKREKRAEARAKKASETKKAMEEAEAQAQHDGGVEPVKDKDEDKKEESSLLEQGAAKAVPFFLRHESTLSFRPGRKPRGEPAFLDSGSRLPLVHVPPPVPLVILPIIAILINFLLDGLYSHTDRDCCRRGRAAGVWISRLRRLAGQSRASAGPIRRPRSAQWAAGQHPHESAA